MPRRNHIRAKLGAALAVPLVALVGMAGYEAVSASRQAEDVRGQAELTRAALGPDSVVRSIQDERSRAWIDLVGLGGSLQLDVVDNAAARAATDEAVDALRAQVAAASQQVAAAFAPAFSALEDKVDFLRADIDGYAGPRDASATAFGTQVFDRYSELTSSFLDATSRLALQLDHSALRNGVDIIDASSRHVEVTAYLVRAVVSAQLTGGQDDPNVRREVVVLSARSVELEREVRTAAVGPYAPVGETPFASGVDSAFGAEVGRFVAEGTANLDVLLAAVQEAGSADDVVSPADVAAASLAREAGDVLDDAELRRVLFIVACATAIVLAALVTWLTSLSITRPLQSLRQQAEAMAGERLPEAVQRVLDTPMGEDVTLPDLAPIEVASRDEVAEVAGALNTVQASALQLAVEQAVLRRNIADSFVNLGRRNQNLLNRQLDFITELERHEADPDALEGLFKLDHLATRMRRNAESLLVLAGIEPPRQWSAPVKASDVVRAALGEVEDYQRVVIRHLEPAAVTGSAAADVAHVLAELIENALAFSPPHEPVEIRGKLSPAVYTLVVSDGGLGMRPEEIARANRRLAGAESFTVAPSRYLGHYVAGHLAARLGVHVALQAGPAGGIVAKVDVPMNLLVDDPTLLPVIESAPERRPADPQAPPAPPAVRAFGEPTGRELLRTENGLPRRGSTSSVGPAARDGSSDVPRVVPAFPPVAPLDPRDLPRRVPGAQRPDTPLAGPPEQTDDPPERDGTGSTPDDVYASLSSFQSGVARGLAEANHRDDGEDQ